MRICKTCVMWRFTHRLGETLDPRYGDCRLNPVIVEKKEGDWCGQHVAGGETNKFPTEPS